LKRNACKNADLSEGGAWRGDCIAARVQKKCRGMHLKNAEEIRRKIAIDRKIHLLEFLDFLFSRFCLFVAQKFQSSYMGSPVSTGEDTTILISHG